MYEQIQRKHVTANFIAFMLKSTKLLLTSSGWAFYFSCCGHWSYYWIIVCVV